ncbi:hypothetical protein ACW9HQ_50210, partial [Nocardia gipuzkoensis]
GIVARMTLPAEMLAAEQDPLPPTIEAKAPRTVIEPAWGADSVTHTLAQQQPVTERMPVPEPLMPAPKPEPLPPAARAPELPAPSADPGAQTTRNGLVRRNKRARADAAPSSPQQAERPAAPRRERGPAPQRSPEETASMLASFRAGHERGATTNPTVLTAEENW